MRDLLAQGGVGGQPVGVEIARLFPSLMKCGICIGGIGAEETFKAAKQEIFLGNAGEHLYSTNQCPDLRTTAVPSGTDCGNGPRSLRFALLPGSPDPAGWP
jgi:hypothetical protein